jgi:hypothetical protein
VPFRNLWDDFSVRFGYPYPVHTTLDDIPFLQHGGIGRPPGQGGADLAFTPWAESEQLWLRDDEVETGVWYHGSSPAGSPLVDVVPGKGLRYRGEDHDPEWDVNAGFVYNNIYWRRVPVRRPYGSH